MVQRTVDITGVMIVVGNIIRTNATSRTANLTIGVRTVVNGTIVIMTAGKDWQR